MKSVFVAQHEYEWYGHDQVKFIGVYATRSDAESAIARLRGQPGFRDWPDGFVIDEYSLGEDHWVEGFSTMVNILVPSTAGAVYNPAVAAWRPTDIYEIFHLDTDADTSFKVGDLVKCEERQVDGNPRALVAVKCVTDPGA